MWLNEVQGSRKGQFNPTTNKITIIQKQYQLYIYLLRRLPDFLPQSSLKVFYNSYILPTLSYCDIVWSNCTNARVNQLERLQNQAGRIILKRRRADSATKLRQDLNWPTLKSLRKLHLPQQIFKCKSNSAPSYLKNLLKLYQLMYMNILHACPQVATQSHQSKMNMERDPSHSQPQPS